MCCLEQSLVNKAWCSDTRGGFFSLKLLWPILQHELSSVLLCVCLYLFYIFFLQKDASDFYTSFLIPAVPLSVRFTSLLLNRHTWVFSHFPVLFGKLDVLWIPAFKCERQKWHRYIVTRIWNKILLWLIYPRQFKEPYLTFLIVCLHRRC